MDDREYKDLTVESQTEEVEAAEPTESQPKKCGLTIAEFGKPQKPREGSIFSLLFEGLDVVVTAMIAVIIIFIFVFKVPTIDGNSMNDTLFHGERVVISSLFYEPQYGDIVVISRNYYNRTVATGQSASPIIKRVIATAGQNVYIDFNAGNVYVFDDDSLLDELRGKTFDDSLKEKMKKYMLDEPYTRTPTNNSGNVTFPAKVPDNCVFVLGDNRNDSRDSRFSDIGMVDKRYIMGKAIMRVFPFEKFGKIG